MADPDITSFQTARRQQATGEVLDPITGEKRITGFPRAAVSLEDVVMLAEEEQ